MDDNNNFLDKNTLYAIALSVLFFVGWQYYVSKKYPNAYKKKEVVESQVQTESLPVSETQTEKVVNEKPESKQDEWAQATETSYNVETFEFENEFFRAKLSSLGMGIEYLELKKYSDRDEKPIRFENETSKIGNFATLIDGEPLKFKMEQKSDKHFVGVAQTKNQTLIKEMIFNPEKYTLDVSIKTLSGKALAGTEIESHITNRVLKIESSFLTPAYEGTEFFSIEDGSEERERIDITKNTNASFKKTTLTSIGSTYFALAMKDNTDIIPKATVNYDAKTEMAYARLFHPEVTTAGKTLIQYRGFVGPKEFDILKNLDGQFTQLINFGVFSMLSKPILKMLKWFYSLIHNWGLAIIFLTICIRILLLPINVSSYKSMKKMQKIQPQLKAIKEKYKGDPQRVNQETMALMKKEKASPLGGCLPMFLQIPVFFALYSAISQSVELYKQPFAFWIQDLSYQDPFFVLPVAVGALYFVQMSMTPQTGMDPAQAKIMKFVPILFCFFMITVPSGLTLYFFVNTVFGIGQQFIFQRDRRKAAAA